jgi:PAS domain S-box-containing protein
MIQQQPDKLVSSHQNQEDRAREELTERVELEKQLRKQAENLEILVAERTKELADSQARLEKLAANLPGAIYQFKLDPDGILSFPFISSGCKELCEITPEQVITEPQLLLSMIHSEDMSNFERAVAVSAKTLQPKHWEGRIITPSGKTKWVQTASKPEQQPDGGIMWDGLMMDISDRKNAEQELRESQQLLQLVFDTLPQRVFWKDQNLRYLGCNKLFAQDAGLSFPEEIVGKNDFDLSWHKSAHLYQSDDRVVVAGGSPKINYEESRTISDGSLIKLKTNRLALKDKNGKIIGLFGSYEDVSDLNQQRQEAKTAKDFLEKAINSISNPIFVKDTNHRWVLVNDAYCQFVGSTKAEMLGKSEPDFFSPEEADLCWTKDELVMLTGREEIDEEPITDANGNKKIVVTKKSCFQDLDGSTFLLGMIIEIRKP